MLDPRLARWFGEYAAAHRHPMNNLTHKIAIPIIVYHILAMLELIHLGPAIAGVPLTAAHVLAVVGLVFYLRLSAPLTLMMVAAAVPIYALARVTPLWVAVVAAVVGWSVQLSGHAVWEKNRPAFVKNLGHALIGPLYYVAMAVGMWPGKVERAA